MYVDVGSIVSTLMGLSVARGIWRIHGTVGEGEVVGGSS